MNTDDLPTILEAGPVRLPVHRLKFTFARASGPGGQNVNKLNTKAQLEANLDDLAVHMNVAALERLKRLAGNAVTQDGRLMLTCEQHRSQIDNRRECLDKLRQLIDRAMVRPKRRKPTKPTRGSRERRIKEKKKRGEIKKTRRNPEP